MELSQKVFEWFLYVFSAAWQFLGYVKFMDISLFEFLIWFVIIGFIIGEFVYTARRK